MMLKAAYLATNNSRYLMLQRKAFDWFLGDNDLGIPLYDFRTKGCNDGLERGGVNCNQGAESTLSFILSLLEIIESYAIVDKITEGVDSAKTSQIVEPEVKNPLSIKNILTQSKIESSQVEEIT